MHDIKKIKGGGFNCSPVVLVDFWLFDVGPVLVGFEARGFAVQLKRVVAILVETPSFFGDMYRIARRDLLS